MRELLGGKGANLAEMNLIGIPVPPGFTITTEVCTEYYSHGREKVIEMLRPEVEAAMKDASSATRYCRCWFRFARERALRCPA